MSMFFWYFWLLSLDRHDMIKWNINTHIILNTIYFMQYSLRRTSFLDSKLNHSLWLNAIKHRQQQTNLLASITSHGPCRTISKSMLRPERFNFDNWKWKH